MSKTIRATDSSLIKGVSLSQLSSETINNLRFSLKIVSPLVEIPFLLNVNWNVDNYLFANARITLLENCTLTLSGLPSVSYGNLIVKQDSVGGHLLSLPGIGDKEILTAPLSESWINFTNLGERIRWGMGRGMSL